MTHRSLFLNWILTEQIMEANMKVRGNIRFDMEFESWEDGWKKLKMVAELMDSSGIKGVGRIDSMGFE